MAIGSGKDKRPECVLAGERVQALQAFGRSQQKR
jgi:hypothetical protein